MNATIFASALKSSSCCINIVFGFGGKSKSDATIPDVVGCRSPSFALIGYGICLESEKIYTFVGEYSKGACLNNIIACSRQSNVEIWMGSRRDGWTSYIVCAGFGLTVSGFSTTWLPQIVPRTFLRYFATFVIATRVRPHTRGLFSKESKRQKFDWETGGTGRTSCFYGAGFGCLFRGSLPCLIPFAVPRVFLFLP